MQKKNFILFREVLVKQNTMNNIDEFNTTPIEIPHGQKLSQEEYERAHEYLVVACHDVFILHSKGILLVKRLVEPAKDQFWPVGGRLLKGVPLEKSLQIKAKDECGLDISSIANIGSSRTIFDTDPFGHGCGTDTLNIIYTAIGDGVIQLNSLHTDYIIVTKDNYTPELKAQLHPYVNKYLEISLNLLTK